MTAALAAAKIGQTILPFTVLRVQRQDAKDGGWRQREFPGLEHVRHREAFRNEPLIAHPATLSPPAPAVPHALPAEGPACDSCGIAPILL